MKKTENQGISALKVMEGIEQPSQINEHFVKNLPKTKPVQSPEYYFDGIRTGNRTILSQAITLIESSIPNHQKTAQEVIKQCLPFAGNSLRIGITGVPGVGKSTFIEALGKHLTIQGKKLAILAIDPSSQRSKGSILGDKTRMEELANDPNAFIRPSPSAGTLGGVARKTRESSILCEAAGFDIIIIETVGVGQSETAVHAMVDFFLLLMLAGAGDELQGIKRGIMEMADAIIINKADGDNKIKANLARIEYQNALHLFPPAISGWYPKVETCSALEKERIGDVWQIITDYVDLTQKTGYFHQKRNEQLFAIMHETINNHLIDSFYNNPLIVANYKLFEKELLEYNLSPYAAARKLTDIYFGEIERNGENQD
jgi:LAO/AO transport system kinase